MNRAGVAGRKRKLREHKFDPAALDPDQPSAFYLPDDEGMLADVTLAVGEHRLPVHSHVLALASPVLRGALLGQADGRTAGASQAAAPTELATPFSDHTLEAVCCFLRLIYFPELAGYKRNLATLGCQTFAGVVRLSHTLQTSRLLSQLKRHATAEGASVEQLVAFQNAAEACQDLEDARKRAFELLVSMFARPGAVIPDQVRLVAAQLQWQPLGELFQAVLDGQATGKFTWRFGCVSQGGHNSDYDDDCARYQSPIFAAVGHAWQLVLYVDDLDEGDAIPDANANMQTMRGPMAPTLVATSSAGRSCPRGRR